MTHRIYINRAHVFNEGVTWTTVAGLYPHAYVPAEYADVLVAERDAAVARAEKAEGALAIIEPSVKRFSEEAVLCDDRMLMRCVDGLRAAYAKMKHGRKP